MKIVLAALNAKYVHSNLAVYALEAYTSAQCEQSGCTTEPTDCQLIVREFTINHNLDTILQELYRERAEVYAFSCYIWNIYEVISVSRELKKVLPVSRIWYGGPEVSYAARKYLSENDFIEGVIVGEGERTFYELVECWRKLPGERIDREQRGEKADRQLAEETIDRELSEEKVDMELAWGKEKGLTGVKADRKLTGERIDRELTGEKENRESVTETGQAEMEGNRTEQSYQEIAGIVYRRTDGSLQRTADRALLSMDELPFVYGDMAKFKNKIIYYESSRGCPFSCSYCLSSIDKTVRFRSLERVKRELDFFLEQRVPQVKFVDRTFNCNRKHALAIWQYLQAHDNGVTNFHFEIAADLIGEEELAVFQGMRRGLIQLEIGLQSTNPDTLREIRRTTDIDCIRRNMLRIRSFGNIHQHLDLIAGLPYEDYQSFRRSFQDAYEMKPNQLQVGFLKVLKGSYMGERFKEYELLYQDTQPYEVLSTRWLGYAELLRIKRVEEMVEVYYNSDQFEHVLPYVLSFWASPYDFYEALGNYYEDRGLFGISLKREARYQSLRDFCIEQCDGEKAFAGNVGAGALPEKNTPDDFSIELFDSLLTFDYYLRENAKNRPGWSLALPIDKASYQEFFKRGGNAELSLMHKGYDSKAAARRMHIEPMVGRAFPWIADLLSTEAQKEHDFENGAHPVYCLFDYENRNPLTGDATVHFLHGLN